MLHGSHAQGLRTVVRHLIDLINFAYLPVVSDLKRSIARCFSATMSVMPYRWFLTLGNDDEPG